MLECDPRDPTKLICSTDPGGSEDQSQPELCNGIDDDCDGEVDEDFSIGEPCPAECISLTGNKCSCGWGTWECDPDDPRQRRTICSTDPGGSEYEGTAEVCDGIDNDCDGEIDNWFFPNINNPSDYGTPGAICLGLGECGTGFYECAGPDYVRCDVDYGGSHYAGQPEVCDGRDNDCDGQVDEDFGVGQPCDGQGECGPGVYECDGLHDVRCSTDFGGSQYEGSVEICDGLDNDCDGYIDEDYGVGSQCDGIGECGIGEIECATTNTTRCSTEPGGSQDQSMPEICDSKDNDCDGVADEDFDLMHDVYNCGYCGHVCQCPNGSPTCNNGTCECNCDPGWYDMDGDPSNGCECQQEASDPGDVCSQARQTSPYALSDSGSGQSTVITGKLVPYGDVDWYTFYAVDTTDTSCDNFHVRVRFLSNPGDQFRFAILRASCTEGGGNVLCSEGTDFTFATDFSNTAPSCIHGGGDGSNHRGECPCYPANASCGANPNYCYQNGCCRNQGSSCWPNITNACCSTSGGVNRCTDNSATFYLKVYRKPGAQGSCDQYRIEISNGVFSSN